MSWHVITMSLDAAWESGWDGIEENDNAGDSKVWGLYWPWLGCVWKWGVTHIHTNQWLYISGNQPIEGYPIFRATSKMFQLQPLSDVWRRLKKAKLEFSFYALIHGDRSWSSSRLSCFCWNWFCHNLRPEHLRCFTWGQIPLRHEGCVFYLFMCGRRNPHGAPSMNP